MALALRLARRSLSSRPGRTLFSILGIALGIATVVGVVVLDHNTIVGLSAPLRGVGAEIELTSRSPAGDETVELADIEGVSLATRFFQADGVVEVGAAGSAGAPEGRAPEPATSSRARIVALELENARALGLYRVARGRDLDPAAGEVLIGTALAEKLGLEPGDTLHASRPRRAGKKRCVDGVLVESEGPVDHPERVALTVAGILAREKLGRNGAGLVALVDFPVGRQIFRGVHVDERWWARRDQAVDVERLEATLARTTSFELDKGAILGQAADERAFRTGVRMAGLLALVLGLYVIFHTLSMSLTERVGEVGTLYALGTTRAQIARVFLCEALALAGGGALLGVAGGLSLARGLLAVGITTLGTGKRVDVFVVPWASTALLAALGFLIALIGSVYPLVTLRGASAVRALRGEEILGLRKSQRGFHLLYALLLAFILPGAYLAIAPVIGRVSGDLASVLLGLVAFLGLAIVLSLIVPAVLAGACAGLARPLTRLWPLAGRLAARGMRTAPARIGVSTAALALVSAGLVGLHGMTRSLRGEIEAWADEALADKVWVRNLPPTEFAPLAAHLHTFGALGVEKGAARIFSPFLILSVDVDELARYGPCADDPALLESLRSGRGILLSRRLAQDLEYRVGEPVRIERADGRVETLTVAAISDAYGHFPDPDERMYGLVSDELMEAYYCVDTATVTEVAVRLPAQEDPSVVQAAIEAYYGGPHEIGFKTGAEVRAHHLLDLGRDFVLFDVLVALTAALAGLGLLNGQLLAALERAKELGVLRALGSTRAQLGGMILIEAAVIGLVGGVLGTLVGSGMTPWVVGALSDLAGLDLPQRGVGPWALWAPAGSVLLALAAALYPVWRVAHVDAVRAVRTG